MPTQTRIRAACLLLAAFALWGIVGRIVLDSRMLRARTVEETASYAQRLAPVRPYLSAGGFVDYVSDFKLNGDDYWRGYYNARYVLSPVKLAWKRPCDYAVGNFADAANIAPMLRERGYVVEQDFGNGVLLLRRAKQ